MRLAIVGIRGIPNNYGGFETLAEYLVEYLATEILKPLALLQLRYSLLFKLLASLREGVFYMYSNQ